MTEIGKWWRKVGSDIDQSQHLPPPRQQPGRPTPRSLLGCLGKLQTESRQPSSLYVESSSMVQEPSLLSARPLGARKTESTRSENSTAREEHSRNEAQDHWERLVLTKLEDTTKFVTDLTQSQHLNFHIRQSVAGAAAGTLRKNIQQWTFWSKWTLERGILPG